MKNRLTILMVAMLMISNLTACQSEKNQAVTEEKAIEVIYENTSTDTSEDSSEKTKRSEEDEGILSLAAKDLDGNELTLGDCIRGNKVTMLNVWGTFCGPCIKEMPYLAELHEQYKGDGFGIVGITCDVLSDYDDGPILSAIADGKDIVESTGVTYPIIMETREMKEIFLTSVVPVSYFVDSKGQLMGEIVTGSKSKSDWEKLINEKLSEVK